MLALAMVLFLDRHWATQCEQVLKSIPAFKSRQVQSYRSALSGAPIIRSTLVRFGSIKFWVRIKAKTRPEYLNSTSLP